MKENELNEAIYAITEEVLCKLYVEEIILDTMINHNVHPFSNDVTEKQVHIAFNQIHQEVIIRLKNEV